MTAGAAGTEGVRVSYLLGEEGQELRDDSVEPLRNLHLQREGVRGLE